MIPNAEVVLPSDCVFVFSLPLSCEDFRRTAHSRDSYSAQYIGGWPQYKKLFADQAEDSILDFQYLGVEVLKLASGEAFTKLFVENRWKVVILFSHWAEGRVEFADQFWAFDSIISLLPLEAALIVDLCVCHPNALVEAISRERKALRICWTDRRRSPWVWFSFYASLFRVLSKGTYSYFQAFQETATAYIHAFGGPLQNEEVACLDN